MAELSQVEPAGVFGPQSAPWPVVLWDFDGTLADTSGDVWASIAYVAREFGSELPREFTLDGSNLALPMAQIMASLSPSIGVELLGEFDAEVTRHYRTVSAHSLTELYPGIESLLVDLSSCGVRHWIVTNKPQGALERLLTLKGWKGLFDGWVCPDSVAGQSDLTKAQMIDVVLNACGVAPRDCAMVGDSWGDVEGAKKRGVASIAVTYGDGDVERLLAYLPDYVAGCADELRGLLLRG